VKEIRICTGTTCYVLGAAELLGDLESAPDTALRDARITGATCLGYCKSREHGEAPFVEIDGTPVSGATLEKIEEAL
jgi:NADH:ubiquinone oxidoreductase subunit E